MTLSGLRLIGPRDMSMLCPIRKTMLGPCLGHIRAIFWLYIPYLCFFMPKIAQIFTEESCMPNRIIQFNVKLLTLYNAHVYAILRPYFGYFYNISACRCLKWLKFSLKSHACQIEEYSLMLIFLDHIWAIFWT